MIREQHHISRLNMVAPRNILSQTQKRENLCLSPGKCDDHLGTWFYSPVLLGEYRFWVPPRRPCAQCWGKRWVLVLDLTKWTREPFNGSLQVGHKHGCTEFQRRVASSTTEPHHTDAYLALDNRINPQCNTRYDDWPALQSLHHRAPHELVRGARRRGGTQ